MSSNCVNKIIAGLSDPSCLGKKKQGGLKKRIWIGNFDDVRITLDADGYVDSVTLSGTPTPTLYKFVGKEFKHNYTNDMQVGENLNTWKPALNLKLYYYTPRERDAIDGLKDADQLIAFVERVGGEGKAQIEVLGLTNGLKASAGGVSSGTAINDDTTITITLSGEEANLPRVLKSGAEDPGEDGYLTVNTEYLNSKSA